MPALDDSREGAHDAGENKPDEELRTNPDSSAGEPSDARPERRFLLIETNEESVRPETVENAERASSEPVAIGEFSRPKSLRCDIDLQPHQVNGVAWLQTCCQIDDRRGVLLADDM